MGTALPGMTAERIWPDALATLADQLSAVVVVIGTNGKTTTTGLIDEVLGGASSGVISNRSGSNMRQGIITTVIRESDLHGRLHAREGGRRRSGVFEVDEAALGQMLPELGPAVIVATNLFRDQLDRYGEADSVVQRWAAALQTADIGSVLVYCGDDPRLAMLAAGSPLASRSFGLNGAPADRDQPEGTADAVADPITCPSCDRQLTYAWRSIGHLGAYACPEGHISRAAPDIAVELLAAGPMTRPRPGENVGTAISVMSRYGGAFARPALSGLANAYNVAAAVAAGTVLGERVEQVAAAIEGYAGPFGRFEWLDVDGRHVAIVLIKNTISLAETVRLGPRLGADVVLLALNDAPADSRDVSWIWDSPVASLIADRVVVLTGTRSADLELRIKYDLDAAAAPPRSIERHDSLSAALDAAVARSPRGGTVVVAATYTAMMGLRAVAQRRGFAPPVPH